MSWCISHPSRLVIAVAKGDLDLSKLGVSGVVADSETDAATYKDLLDRIQKALGERASAVRVTHRLTDSPACLVTDEHAMSTNLERLLKAAGQKVPTMRPIL